MFRYDNPYTVCLVSRADFSKIMTWKSCITRIQLNSKLSYEMRFSCSPNKYIIRHVNDNTVCLIIGTERIKAFIFRFGTNGNLMILAIPLLKHISIYVILVRQLENFLINIFMNLYENDYF